MDALRFKTVYGVFWTFLEQFGRRGISALVTILLARFLTPDDYGLIAMTSVFFAFANAIMDAGFRQALIRKKDATQADYSTIFYANIFLGLIAYAILFLSSSSIANFYLEPRLVPLVRIVGIVVVINSFQVIHIVDLSRKFDFKTQFKITIPAGVVSGIIAIVLAMNGAGVWSLVAQMLISPFLITISLWCLNAWRPTLEFSLSSFNDLFEFGSKMFLSGILDIAFRNIYVIVIAKLYSPGITGCYFFATKIWEVVLAQFCSGIQSATFPVLASLQDDNTRLKNGYRKVMQATAYILFPAMIFMAVMAKPIFELFLNEKWLPSILYLQLLCVAGLMYPLHVVNLNILQVKGRSDLFLYLEIVKKGLVVIAVVFSSKYGIVAILLGQICTSFLAYLPNSYFSVNLIGYSIREQLKDITPPLLAALLGGLVATLVSGVDILAKHALVMFVLQIIFSSATYFMICGVANIEIQNFLLGVILKRNVQSLPRVEK